MIMMRLLTSNDETVGKVQQRPLPPDLKPVEGRVTGLAQDAARCV